MRLTLWIDLLLFLTLYDISTITISKWWTFSSNRASCVHLSLWILFFSVNLISTIFTIECSRIRGWTSLYLVIIRTPTYLFTQTPLCSIGILILVLCYFIHLFVLILRWWGIIIFFLLRDLILLIIHFFFRLSFKCCCVIIIAIFTTVISIFLDIFNILFCLILFCSYRREIWSRTDSQKWKWLKADDILKNGKVKSKCIQNINECFLYMIRLFYLLRNCLYMTIEIFIVLRWWSE